MSKNATDYPNQSWPICASNDRFSKVFAERMRLMLKIYFLFSPVLLLNWINWVDHLFSSGTFSFPIFRLINQDWNGEEKGRDKPFAFFFNPNRSRRTIIDLGWQEERKAFIIIYRAMKMMRRRYSSPVIVLLSERFALAIKSSFSCVWAVCVSNCDSVESLWLEWEWAWWWWLRRATVASISTLDRENSRRHKCKRLDHRRWNLSEPVRKWDNSPCRSKRIDERGDCSPASSRLAANRSDRRDWRWRDTSVESLSTIVRWAERTRRIRRSPAKRRSTSVPVRTGWSVGTLGRRRAESRCWRCIRSGDECAEKRCRASLRCDR